MKRLIILSIAVMFFTCFLFIMFYKKEQKSIYITEELSTEKFVKSFLYTGDGLIKTDITNQSDVYLSESLGLWMQYLVAKNDVQEFEKQYNILKMYFLEDDDIYLIPWRIVNSVPAESNALIDDFRIMAALYEASNKWNNLAFKKTAKKIAKDIANYNLLEDIFINHVDLNGKYQGDFLTLSYLNPVAIQYMVDDGIISKKEYERNREILVNAPVSENGLFPFTYNPNNRSYEFEEKVNLIDQYYVGYYRALWGGDVSSLVKFTKDALNQYNGLLFGRFSASSLEPIVNYEGSSVYALAILMCLEVGEEDLAKRLYTRMKELQVNDNTNEFYGGYIELYSLETHAFDNLLPLLAERRGLDEEVFE